MTAVVRFDPYDPSLTPGSADPISANGQYRIPVTNPYDGPGEVPEMYAIGLRNPYRFAFDTLTGEPPSLPTTAYLHEDVLPVSP